MFDEDTLIDWQREANEDMRTLRFCPNCANLVQLKFKEHKFYQNFYNCPKCGDTVLIKGTIRSCSHSYGYSQRKQMLDESY